MNISYNSHNQVSTGVVIYCYTLVSQLQFGLLCLTVCTQLQKPGRKTLRFYLNNSKKDQERFTQEAPLNHAAEAE